jgi:sugar transferase (PEP-CTERM/EpsH1 system associated)
MRITHVVENLNRGGLERVVIDLARTQAQRGHACEVVCLFERGLLADELEAQGVPVHACGKRGGLDMRAALRLRRLLRAHGAEVVHTHNAMAHYYAVPASLGLDVRRINTRHGMAGLATSTRREWLFRLSLPFTAAVVTVCEAARRDLLRVAALPSAKLIAIPNGIAIERFKPADADEREKRVATLGLPARTRLIVTVGRLTGAKNHESLVRAFIALRRERPDIALAIIGDGELREPLATMARAEATGGRVLLLGDRSDVSDLLPGCDVFAMSSLTEGYSVALLEACAAGLPIVATDVGGNAEIVHEGVNGRLVPPGDDEALATTLGELLGDQGRAGIMGRAGRNWVEQQGSLQQMARRYEALYADPGKEQTRLSAE